MAAGEEGRGKGQLGQQEDLGPLLIPAGKANAGRPIESVSTWLGSISCRTEEDDDRTQKEVVVLG